MLMYLFKIFLTLIIFTYQNSDRHQNIPPVGWLKQEEPHRLKTAGKKKISFFLFQPHREESVIELDDTSRLQIKKCLEHDYKTAG